jgi:hypothetical protein
MIRKQVFWARSTNHPSFNSTSTNLGEVQGDKLSSDGRLFAQKPLPFSRGAAASCLRERMLLMRHLHKQCCLPLKHDSSDLFLSNHAYIDALSLSLSLSVHVALVQLSLLRCYYIPLLMLYSVEKMMNVIFCS